MNIQVDDLKPRVKIVTKMAFEELAAHGRPQNFLN
jgi:hypothetical protein